MAIYYAALLALASATAPVSVNGQRITNVGAPSASTDAATKAYVDSASGGVPTSRTLTAGAGLTGGGDLSADRTFTVVAGDTTLVVNADELHVNPDLVLTSTLSVGGSTANVASAGTVRLVAAPSIQAKSSVSGNLTVWSADGSDNVTMGDTGTVSVTHNAKTAGYHAWQVNSVESMRVDSSQLLVTAGAMNIAVGTTFSIAQAQSASGAGRALTISAQKGVAGQVGGNLVLVAGDGGTAGTNAPGNIDLKVLTSVSGVGGKTRVFADGASVLELYMLNASTFYVNAVGAASILRLNAVGGGVVVDAANARQFDIGVSSAGFTFSVPYQHISGAAISTTDGTTEVQASSAYDFATLSGFCYGFRYVFVAKDGSGNGAQFVVTGCVQNVAGTATIAGTNAVVSSGTAALLASAPTVKVAATSKIRPGVTGVAATTITWAVHGETWRVV